jgi:hypothetical protein
MKILFEDQSSASENFSYKMIKRHSLTTFHQGKRYMQIGRSFQARSLSWRILRTIELISFVGLGVLCLLIPFSFNSFRQFIKTKSIEVLSGKEQIDHWIPFTIKKHKQLWATQNLVPYLKDGLKTEGLAAIKIESMKCFIRINFEYGEIKKEFIIENLTNIPLDEAFVEKQAVKIKQHLDDEIIDSLGAFTKLDLMLLLKDDKGRFHKRTNNEDRRFHSGDRSTIMDLKQKEMGSTLTFLMNTMGFPKERHFENGKFIPGTFYQAII